MGNTARTRDLERALRERYAEEDDVIGANDVTAREAASWAAEGDSAYPDYYNPHFEPYGSEAPEDTLP